MLEKFTISRDDLIYQAWPDVALTSGNRLVCVFSECTHHGDRTYTRIMFTISTDRGRTWAPKRPLSEPLRKSTPADPHWNCARITALADGRLVVVVDQICGGREGSEPEGCQTNWLFFSEDAGESWQGPRPTPARGIVPDKLKVLEHGPRAGCWLLSVHTFLITKSGEVWKQWLWSSPDQGATWEGPVTIAESAELKLCEGSLLELPDGELVCFLRENSFAGLDAYKAISRDGGLTWTGVFRMPMPGCHRPVAGLLQSGRVLITHRYLPGGRGGWGQWTQNTFAALTDPKSCLAIQRRDAATRVFPLDFDRSPHADTGYTGWVQFSDGEIYVVNYLLDDAPQAQIRGYSLRESDLILE